MLFRFPHLVARGKSHGFSRVAAGTWGIFSSYNGDTHSKRELRGEKETSEDTGLTPGGRVGCLRGISPFGFLRCESATYPVHPQRTRDTSCSLSSLTKAQSHQLIACGNPQRGARESQYSFLQINSLCLCVQSYFFVPSVCLRV